MTNTLIKILPILTVFLFVFLGFKSKPTNKSSYKCMIQMINYSGEGAYISISLINSKGDYEKTLYVQGDDDEWYSDITEWWKFHGKVRTDIDAITGATIGSGERNISVIYIDDDKIDAGYKIRFESAVEDQAYYKDDVEFELTSASVKSKVEGHGVIRHVRLMPQ